MATAKKPAAAKKEITSRVEVVSATDAAPRYQNVEYTVLADYADGSSRPIGTVGEFAECDTLKATARMQASASGAVIKGFRVFERDHDSHRRDDHGNPKHMIESEVA